MVNCNSNLILKAFSSSKYADSMGSFDSVLPFILIGFHSWQISSTASSVCTEMMNIRFCYSANTGLSVGRSSLENIAYEFILLR